MEPFLKQVVDHYLQQDGLCEKMFIFPNRRSMAFFRHYLQAEIKRRGTVLLCPRLATINDFFYSLTGKAATERIPLLLKLYECYCAVYPKHEPLDDFIYWGDVILSDFDDLDKYLVDARMIFANIADLKSIRDDFSYADDKQKAAIEKLAGHFSALQRSDNPRRDVKGNFLDIWQVLYPLYQRFRAELDKDDMAYEGMVYRKLADSLDKESVADLLLRTYPDVSCCVFVGLNALNGCEKKILGRMKDAGLARFCWDFPDDNLFRRENLPLLGSDFTPMPITTKPAIRSVKIPSSTGQAKLLPSLINQVPDAERGIDFAVVLADETMLMSVLNSLPACEDGVNVTMGYPMRESEWAALLKDIVALQLNLREKNGELYFYHRNVSDILSSSLMRAMMSDEDRSVVEDIIKGAKYYVPVGDFAAAPLLSKIFVRGDESLPRYLLDITCRLAPKCVDDNALQADFAQRYYLALGSLADLDIDVSPRTWAHLVDMVTSGISVPFEGEPLGGLQVMGPLETRALDFRHIVILGANEGVFPRINSRESFIPAEVRTAFGLPTYVRQDAIWAYYFYRMIARAENVWMVYDSRTEGLNTGEESRYIKQLRYLANDKYDFAELVAQSEVNGSGLQPTIKKTPEDVEKIRNGVFSASLIHKYISCPVQFYYYFIKDLKRDNDIKESLDSGMLGEVTHNTLQALYCGEEAMKLDRPFDKREGSSFPPLKLVTKEYLESWLKREDEIRTKVLSLIRHSLRTVEVSGQDLVTADIIVKYVVQVIKSDIARMGAHGSFKLLGLEHRPEATTIAGHKFSGYVDRIDSFRDGVVRIVDYKTGSDHQDVLSSKTTVSKIFGNEAYSCKAALQFFIYDRLLAAEKDFEGSSFENSMYSMADLFTTEVKSYPVSEEFGAEIEERLEKTFDEMENTDVDFVRTDSEQTCALCDYRVLCSKVKKD